MEGLTLGSGWQQAILLGGWLGLIHALDADHLATIGGLAVNDRAMSPVGYASRWAIGHAAALGSIAVLVLGLGLGATQAVVLSSYAELLVAITLVAIGCHSLLAAWRGAPPAAAAHALGHARAHLHFLAPFHRHSELGMKSLSMGVLHGGAGSAAVLALLPLARFGLGPTSALYLACFSLGVAAGAIAFSIVFARFSARAAAAGASTSTVFRATVGVLAVAAGALLVVELWSAEHTHGGG